MAEQRVTTIPCNPATLQPCNLLMETIFQLIAIIAVIAGTFFSVVGVLGMVRLPDVYARLHATGKVGVFGVVLLLTAAVVWTPLGWARALLLIALLLPLLVSKHMDPGHGQGLIQLLPQHRSSMESRPSSAVKPN